jgi:hypothetical protein
MNLQQKGLVLSLTALFSLSMLFNESKSTAYELPELEPLENIIRAREEFEKKGYKSKVSDEEIARHLRMAVYNCGTRGIRNGSSMHKLGCTMLRNKR